MAKIKYDEAKNYQQDGDINWISLPDDGSIARVQFLINTLDDIATYAVHKVSVGGKERYVSCIREYDSPIDDCPLCQAGYPVEVIRFIAMYDHNDYKVKLWTRGTQFITRIQGLMNRYNRLAFSEYVFEIERNGKRGDQKTKYEVYPMDGVDAYDVSDVDVPEMLGSFIIDATADEIDVFLTTWNFPQYNQPQEPIKQPPRRGEKNQTQQRRDVPAQTPAQPSAPAPRRAAPEVKQAVPSARPAAPSRRGSTETF